MASTITPSNVYTTQEVNEFDITFANSLNNEADTKGTYLNTDVGVVLDILQAGINNRVLMNSVDTNGKIKLHATADTIFKKSKTLEGSTVYDSLNL